LPKSDASKARSVQTSSTFCFAANDIRVRRWCFAQIASILKSHDAIVERLSLQTQAQGCVVFCRVEGLKTPQAMLAVAQILRLDGTLSARIEHLLLRR